MLANILLAVLASGGGGGSLLDVNPGLIIWTILTFLLLLIILKKVISLSVRFFALPLLCKISC